MPVGAIYVGRPSKWGNPFKVYPDKRGGAFAHHIAVMSHKDWLLSGAADSPLKDISELRGKDLVCWCAPLPCHADVLLELANG